MANIKTGFRALFWAVALAAAVAGGLYFSANPPAFAAGGNVCEPPTDFKVQRALGDIVHASWTNPTSGLTVTSLIIDVIKWDKENENWNGLYTFQLDADKGDFTHSGADTDQRYGYTITSLCSNVYSESSDIVVVNAVHHVGG